MEANELEKIIMGRLLNDPALKPVKAAIDFGRVVVVERNMTGAGFFTGFERSDELKMFDASVSLRWENVGARLNASGLETGYIAYVDDGYLRTLEGYTYGEEWPENISSIEVYEPKLGMEVGG